MRSPSVMAAARLSMLSIAGSAALLLLALSLSLPSAAFAAEKVLTLAEALRLATQDSPLLAAQRSAVSAAEETTAAARELPDPKLKLGIDNLPVDGADRYNLTRDFMTMRKIGVTQEFVRDEKREIKGRRANQYQPPRESFVTCQFTQTRR